MSDGRLDPHPGCWNSERRDAYMAPDGFIDVIEKDWGFAERHQQVVLIKDTSSRECRNDARHEDPRCAGCEK